MTQVAPTTESAAAQQQQQLPRHPPPLSPRAQQPFAGPKQAPTAAGAPTASAAHHQQQHHQLPPAITPFIQTPKIEDAFDKQKLLGEGGYAKVYVAINRKNGIKRAIKIMQKAKLTEKARAMVLHEKEVLRRVSHQSIVRLHQCLQTDTEVCFELDLMRTDLFEFMIEYKKLHHAKAMTEHDTAYVMEQLLSAVAYLHENDIVHRDIKPENILINTTTDIKLADFGLAKVVAGPATRNTPMGTSYYIAPEIIRSIELQAGTPHTTTKDTVKAVDVWACGIVVAFMLSGRPPFIGQIRTAAERKALLNNIDKGIMFEGPYWENVSAEGKDLVAALLEQNLAKRITAAEALKHPFFEKFGRRHFEQLYAHIPDRANSNEAQPVIIIPDDDERDDVGLSEQRLTTMTTTDRDSNWQTPTTTYSRRNDVGFEGPSRSAFGTPNPALPPPMESLLGNGSFNAKDDEYNALKKELDEMHHEILAAGDSQGDLDTAASSPDSGSVKVPSAIRQSKKVRLPGMK